MTHGLRSCYDCGRSFGDLDVDRDYVDPDRCTDCVQRALTKPSTLRPTPDTQPETPDETF